MNLSSINPSDITILNNAPTNADKNTNSSDKKVDKLSAELISRLNTITAAQSKSISAGNQQTGLPRRRPTQTSSEGEATADNAAQDEVATDLSVSGSSPAKKVSFLRNFLNECADKLRSVLGCITAWANSIGKNSTQSQAPVSDNAQKNKAQASKMAAVVLLEAQLKTMNARLDKLAAVMQTVPLHLNEEERTKCKEMDGLIFRVSGGDTKWATFEEKIGTLNQQLKEGRSIPPLTQDEYILCGSVCKKIIDINSENKEIAAQLANLNLFENIDGIGSDDDKINAVKSKIDSLKTVEGMAGAKNLIRTTIDILEKGYQRDWKEITDQKDKIDESSLENMLASVPSAGYLFVKLEEQIASLFSGKGNKIVGFLINHNAAIFGEG